MTRSEKFFPVLQKRDKQPLGGDRLAIEAKHKAFLDNGGTIETVPRGIGQHQADEYVKGLTRNYNTGVMEKTRKTRFTG